MDNLDVENFVKEIPRTVEENKNFRGRLNLLCESNLGFRKKFLDLCSKSPQVMFDVLYWAFNPLEIVDKRLLPFILRPKQIVVLNELNWCIDNQHDFGIEKSRYEGATELVKTLVWKCIFNRDCTFIVGSLKKEDVDNRPDTTTIFAKIDNALALLPKWFNVECERKDMLIYFPQTNSTIIGETTNENFGASKRATAVWLDEFGRLPPKIAESVEGTVRDVSSCIVYCSTHWFGTNHPFNLAINKDTTKHCTLFWWENPEKTKFLYSSPKEGFVELLDIESYRQTYPELIEKYVN